MQKLEHIGIAVKNLEASVALFEKLLDTPCYKREVMDRDKLTTAFFKSGETKIELLEAKDDASVIAKFIVKKGEGLHHIAFAVKDIKAEMKRLSQAGFVLLDQEPRPGADGKLVCFLDPKTSNGVLIELCMNQG
jgi:methylmalonyl-CoA/ethylmalonyl-CoA epimerase